MISKLSTNKSDQTKKYIWEDLQDHNLAKLRDKYKLKDVIKKGKSEFEQQLQLKSWVHQKLQLGYNPRRKYKNAFEILEDAEEDSEFNCSSYVLLYLQCASSLGWYCRKLGVDTDHEFGEEEMTHTVVDIWSNDFNKWYVIDPNFSVYFEKDKIPLNSYEIREELLINGVRDINKVGNIYYSNIKLWHDKPENYYWFFIYLRNNYFENENIYDSKALLWVDKYNKDKTWYKGGKNKGEFREHEMYGGRFIECSDYELCYPEMKNK